MSNLNDFTPKIKSTKVVGTNVSSVTTDQTVDMTGYTDAYVWYDDPNSPGTNIHINFTNLSTTTVPVITQKTLEASNNNSLKIQVDGSTVAEHQIPFGVANRSYLILNNTQGIVGKML